MRYVKLGKSDMTISQVGIGGFSFGTAGWMVGEKKAADIIEKAREMGINYIDTANMYSGGESEEIIGKITSGIRDEVIISTKVGGKMSEIHQGFSRKEIEYNLKQSLDRLNSDFVDIYFLHAWFDSLNMEEMIDILDGVVEDGRARYYGLSNVLGYQLAEFDSIAAERGLVRPEIVQNHSNAVYREDEIEVVPYCRRKSITFSPFSPLAAGFLTGKYRRGEEPKTVRAVEYPAMRKRYFHVNDFDVLDVVLEISREEDITPASLSLAYLLGKGYLPVVGISNPDHLADVQAAIDLNMKEEYMNRIEEPYLPHSITQGNAGYT